MKGADQLPALAAVMVGTRTYGRINGWDFNIAPNVETLVPRAVAAGLAAMKLAR